MTAEDNLKEVTSKLIPLEFDRIDWGDTWERSVEEGSAFQQTTLAAMIEAARNGGYDVGIPLISEYGAGEYYTSRNEIPHAHGALAGNSAYELTSKNLSDMFLYSLVPKATLRRDEKEYSIFIEGCPYHKLVYGDRYKERTDIIVVCGACQDGYPQLDESKKTVKFSFVQPAMTVSGSLTVKNADKIPCRTRKIEGDGNFLTKGIVECSVNKTTAHAKKQMDRYCSLFTSGGIMPGLSLISGNEHIGFPYDSHDINIHAKADMILKQMRVAAKGILNSFSIL